MELLIKYNLGRLCSSLKLELSLKRHLSSLCSSPKLELLSSFAAVFDRDLNRNIQENVRCKFFEKISHLIISIIQIPDSFLDLLLTFVNSSRELTRVMWSFRSHLGQFLNYKPIRDVPRRPDSTWASVLPVQKSWKRLDHITKVSC